MKRNSLGGNTSATNTLFKYFTKSPASSPQTPQQNRDTASVSNYSATPKSSISKDKSIDEKGRSNKKKTDKHCIDDDSPIGSVKKPKRLKLIDTDSDPDRENESGNVQPNKKLARPATSAPSTPQPKKKMKVERKDTSDFDQLSFEDKLKSMEVQDVHDVEEKLEELDDEPVLWPHTKMDFLKPENIKDINGHKPDHPEYNPKTLFVPKSFLDKLTPTQRQWWEFKAENMDCVLFFKVGKFYELYHMDAEIGVQELGFTYMKGDCAHSGFPEQSYDRMATSLVAKGFKVKNVVELVNL